jgi:rare lipoprotein A
MKYKGILLLLFALAPIINSYSQVKQKAEIKQPISVRFDTIKSLAIKLEPPIIDTLTNLSLKFKPFKKEAHASYYHNKFNGKRTASGRKFSNDDYTAAHRKFAFGTLLRITNEKNGKFVIVEVTDRGPFSRGREIDLTRKAFMEIADNKNSGAMKVTIEEEKK